MSSHDLEKAFQRLARTLERPVAGYSKLRAAAGFLESHSALGPQLDSYRLEIAEALPGIVPSADLTTIDPDELEQLHALLSSELAEALSPDSRGALSILASRSQAAYQRVGARPRLAVAQPQPEVRSPEYERHRKFEVWAPVVEFGVGGSTSWGLLCRISSGGFAPGRESVDRVGISGPLLNAVDHALQSHAEAARQARRAVGLGGEPPPLVGQITMDSTDGALYGTSSGLAVGIVCACAMDEAGGRRSYLTPRSGLAASGVLDPEGAVLPVDPDTLSAKVRAVFFSEAKVMAVPLAQRDDAIKERDRLVRRYPDRRLPIYGVRDLEEALADRRLCDQATTPLDRFVGRKLRTQRSRIALVVSAAVIALLSARILWGPIDQNPAEVRVGASGYEVLNAAGSILDRIPLSEGSLVAHQERSGHPYEPVLVADLDADGRNEILWADDRKPEVSVLFYRNYADRTRDWQFPLVFPVTYNDDPQAPIQHYRVLQIALGDLEDDGEPDLVVNARHDTYYPAVVAVLNPLNGEVRMDGERPRFYTHSGNLFAMTLGDYDDDGDTEVILGGVNQSANTAVVVGIGPSGFWGQGPSEGYRIATGIPVNLDNDYLIIPQTEVGAGYDTGYNRVTSVSWSRDTGLIEAQVDDNQREFISGPGASPIRPKLIYSINPDFQIVGRGQTDQYDAVERVLRERGILK